MQTPELPNKCNFCGLKQIYPPDFGTFFKDLGTLCAKGIIKQSFPRKMSAGGKDERDEFCLVANPAWTDIDSPCDSWLLLHPYLSKSDYLSLNAANEAVKSAKSTEEMTRRIMIMTKKVLWATIFSLVIAGFSMCIVTYEWIYKEKQAQIVVAPLQTNIIKSLPPKKPY